MRAFLLFLLLPITAFSQDTLFNKVLSEVTVKSAGQRVTEAAIVRSIRNSNVVSDGLSVEFIKKPPDRTVGGKRSQLIKLV